MAYCSIHGWPCDGVSCGNFATGVHSDSAAPLYGLVALALPAIPAILAILMLRQIVSAGLPDWALVIVLAAATIAAARGAHAAGWGWLRACAVGYMVILILAGAYGAYHVAPRHNIHPKTISAR